MIRCFHTAAIVAGLLISAPAFAADPVVDAIAPPAAEATSRAYATFFAGASLPDATVEVSDGIVPAGLFVDLDFETGYILGGAIGTTILPSLRGEIEFSIIKSTLSESLFGGGGGEPEVNSTGYNLLGNLWYDVDTGSSFTPYIGGGLGWGYDVVTGEGNDEEINTSGWLYQLGAGVRIAATDTIGLDLGYRYRVQPDADITGEVPLDGEIKSSATNHIVTAGVTVGF